MTDGQLILVAAQAAHQAHCPYSGFRVGAALLTSDGRVFTGVNVENASYGLTICAERSAVVAAVTAGTRSFKAIAIAADGTGPVFPCGACLQVLAEFGQPDLRVLLTGVETPGVAGVYSLGSLFPHAFDPNSMKGYCSNDESKKDKD